MQEIRKDSIESPLDFNRLQQILEDSIYKRELGIIGEGRIIFGEIRAEIEGLGENQKRRGARGKVQIEMEWFCSQLTIEEEKRSSGS